MHLESLLGNLSLGSRDGSSAVGVDKATAQLAVLEGSGLGRADADTSTGDLGAACGRAVGISDTSSGDELSGVSGTNVLCAGVVGGEREGGHGD